MVGKTASPAVIPVFQSCFCFSEVPVSRGGLTWLCLAAREAGKCGLQLAGCVPGGDVNYYADVENRLGTFGGLTVCTVGVISIYESMNAWYDHTKRECRVCGRGQKLENGNT